jgi:hypothetical protein
VDVAGLHGPHSLGGVDLRGDDLAAVRVRLTGVGRREEVALARVDRGVAGAAADLLVGGVGARVERLGRRLGPLHAGAADAVALLLEVGADAVGQVAVLVGVVLGDAVLEVERDGPDVGGVGVALDGRGDLHESSFLTMLLQ